MNQHLFLAAFTLLFVCVAITAGFYTLRLRKAGSASWQSLLSRLQTVNRENVALIALDLVEEGTGQRRGGDLPELSSDHIWSLVDGMEGLERIEANCQIFIEIAMYIQRTHPEAVVIAEEFRRNTRHIQWHIGRLRAGTRTGNLASTFADYAQRAVASYYLMSKQLVAVCEDTKFAGLEKLRAAV